MDERVWVPVGKVTRAHGVRGDVRILPYGDTLAGFQAGGKMHVRVTGFQALRTLTLTQIRPHGRFLLARFEELPNPEAAAAIVGGEIVLPEEHLPPTDEGEYYTYQLIGLSVETTAGIPVGTLRAVFDGGSHDIYVVEGRHGKEVLIPAVEDVVTEVDLGRRRMVIDPPEGLIDDL